MLCMLELQQRVYGHDQVDWLLAQLLAIRQPELTVTVALPRLTSKDNSIKRVVISELCSIFLKTLYSSILLY